VSSSAGTPTGTVSFYERHGLAGNLDARIRRGYLFHQRAHRRSHNITAQYPGVAGFAASTSSVVVEVITPPAFSISASPASLSVYTGEAATYTVTVTPGTGFTLAGRSHLYPVAGQHHLHVHAGNVTGGSGKFEAGGADHRAQPGHKCFQGVSPLFGCCAGRLAAAGHSARWRRFRNRGSRCSRFSRLLIAAPAVSGCGGPFTLPEELRWTRRPFTVNGTVSYESQTLTHTATVTLNVESLSRGTEKR